MKAFILSILVAMALCATLAFAAMQTITIDDGDTITVRVRHTPTSTPTPTATASPSAHVAIYDYAANPSDTALHNANVDGALVHVNWNAVETTQGTFDWTATNATIAKIKAAGKNYELDLVGGRQSPSWLIPLVGTYDWLWDQNYGPRLCSTVTSPLPWDINYQAKYANFVGMAAKQYASDPALAGVKLEGETMVSDEIMFPHATGQLIAGGKCRSNNDGVALTALGYSETNTVALFDIFAQMYVTNFPKLPFAAMLTRLGFPNDGTEMPGIVEMALISECGKYANCVVQNNGWMYNKSMYPGASYFQEGAAQGDNLPAAINLALTVNPRLLEIYESDILASDNQTALALAHNTLVK